jgi:plasmid maintenance system antidote protein VapI
MALRIERWLGRDHGGAAEVWLAQQQAAYDLWQYGPLSRPARPLRVLRAVKFQAV